MCLDVQLIKPVFENLSQMWSMMTEASIGALISFRGVTMFDDSSCCLFVVHTREANPRSETWYMRSCEQSCSPDRHSYFHRRGCFLFTYITTLGPDLQIVSISECVFSSWTWQEELGDISFSPWQCDTLIDRYHLVYKRFDSVLVGEDIFLLLPWYSLPKGHFIQR